MAGCEVVYTGMSTCLMRRVIVPLLGDAMLRFRCGCLAPAACCGAWYCARRRPWRVRSAAACCVLCRLPGDDRHFRIYSAWLCCMLPLLGL